MRPDYPTAVKTLFLLLLHYGSVPLLGGLYQGFRLRVLMMRAGEARKTCDAQSNQRGVDTVELTPWS